MYYRCVVFVEDGYTRIMLPSGDILPAEVEGKLQSDVLDKDGEHSKIAYYTATFEVDLVSTRKEAEEKIKNAKTQQKIQKTL